MRKLICFTILLGVASLASGQSTVSLRTSHGVFSIVFSFDPRDYTFEEAVRNWSRAGGHRAQLPRSVTEAIVGYLTREFSWRRHAMVVAICPALNTYIMVIDPRGNFVVFIP